MIAWSYHREFWTSVIQSAIGDHHLSLRLNYLQTEGLAYGLLENGNGTRARNYCWKGIPTCTVRSLSLVPITVMFLPKWLLEHVRLRVDQCTNAYSPLRTATKSGCFKWRFI